MSDIDPKITRRSDKETIAWLLKVQEAQEKLESGETDDSEGQQLSKAFDQVLDSWDWDKSTAELEKIIDQEVKALLQRRSEVQAKAVAEFKLRGNMAHLRPQPIDVVPYGSYIWEDPYIT